MRTDGFFKLAVLMMAVFFELVGWQIQCFRVLVVCEGTILALYWLFEFTWMITGAVMFWHFRYPAGDCNQEFGHYMWALLILSFLLAPLNFFVSIIRGEEGAEETIMAQRITEMSKQ